MGRREGPREGYRLLQWVRSRDGSTPYFIYAGSRAPEHAREAAALGAQGTTNSPSELIDMVTQAIPRDPT
jgi:DNA-binding NarL/FixJ family response regulator